MSDVLEGLEAILQPSQIEWSPKQLPASWSSLGAPLAILRPSTVEQVSRCVAACAAQRVPVVPWGGRTGLAGGVQADGVVAISLERLNRIEWIDRLDGVMLVEAGCVLQTVCEAAEAADMFFPLDIGARGSATIGGAISTNAGGNRVLRFGMMRDLVLGVEAVLADGTIVSALHPLIKNNTGYDLKQLFIGSEGTLGIVTRAMVRLRPLLPSRNAALVAMERFDDVARLLRRLDARLGGQLSAFELMWPLFYELVTTAPAKGRPILPHGHGFYILVEAMGGDPDADAAAFEAVLSDAIEEGAITDAVIAQSRVAIDAMWALRDDGEQLSRIGPYAAFDISLRVSAIEPFIDALRALAATRWPTAKLVLFGHVGDGNIHIVLSLPHDSAEARSAVNDAVLGLVSDHAGSISAEHGIGCDKRAYLSLSRSPAEIDLMRQLKRGLDPDNVLNPGKVLPAS